jgi:long-chain acyl-CoA synthetase
MIKEVQPKTNLRNVIVSNIKDFFPGFLSTLYTCQREERGRQGRTSLKKTIHWLHLLKKYSGKKPPAVEVKPTDRAVFLYTGGTTGVSKGAVSKTQQPCRKHASR